MFLKPVEFIKKPDLLSMPYKGIVVSKDDPRQLKRIKVLVVGLWQGEVDSLPWVFPENPTGLGGRSDSSGVTVPEIGSQILVYFPFKDIYSPFYRGSWQSEGTAQGSFNENYPESYGTRDEQNTQVLVNKFKKFFEFLHASGASFQIEANSAATLRSKNSIKFISEDNQTEFLFDMVTGDVTLSTKKDFEVKGQKTKISSKSIEIDSGSITAKYTGGEDTEMVGGRKIVIGGSDSLSVLGNQASSVGGNKSGLIAGETEVTYGQGKTETVALGDLVSLLVAGNRDIELLVGNHTTLLTAGNYIVDIVAGNLSLKTKAGSWDCGNVLGNMRIDALGNINIVAATTMTIESVALLEMKSALIKIGLGLAPVLTTLTSPVVDFITGTPSIGVPTVLVG